MADSGAPSSSSAVRSGSGSLRIPQSNLWSLFSRISPDHIPGDVRNYLRNVFEYYHIQRISLAAFEYSVLELIKDYPNEVFTYRTMLGDILGQVHYLDRVRVRLMPDNDSHDYMNFLAYLIDYRYGIYTFEEFKGKVRKIFSNHQDLWEQFDEKLDNKPKDTTTGEKPNETVVLSTEPAISKEHSTTVEECTKSNEADTSIAEPASKKQKTT